MSQSNQLDQPTSTRILLVDDVSEVRQVFIRFLDRSGVEVFEAENGAAALRRGTTSQTSW